MAKPSLLDGNTLTPQTFRRAKQLEIEAFERRYLALLLLECDDCLSEASRRAGVDRGYLRRLLRKHDLYTPPASAEGS